MSPTHPGTAARKAELRDGLRRARRERAAGRSPQQRESAARALARHALAYLDTLDPPARCVAVFESLPTEVPTHALIEALHERDLRILLPVMLPDLDLEWIALADPSGRQSPVGIADLRDAASHGEQLLGRAGIGAADVLFVPAMAIDPVGRRLGQGGGSYDRALPRRRPGSVVVALIDDQEWSNDPLPVDGRDEQVDGCICPESGYRSLPDSQDS